MESELVLYLRFNCCGLALKLRLLVKTEFFMGVVFEKQKVLG